MANVVHRSHIIITREKGSAAGDCRLGGYVGSGPYSILYLTSAPQI